MRRETLPQVVLVVLVAAAVIAAVLTVGGPGQGRKERNDDIRKQDLQMLGSYVTCLTRVNEHTVPDTLSEDSRCGTLSRASDPFTGAPYRYEKLSDASYRLCADFEDPETLQRHYGYNRVDFENQTGCITQTYRR